MTHKHTSLPTLLSYSPFIISSNCRFSHHYPTPHLFERWVLAHHVCATSTLHEGHMIIGEVVPAPSQKDGCTVMDMKGSRHVIPLASSPSSSSAHAPPSRVLAIVGSVESPSGPCGGLGLGCSSITIHSGQTLFWLDEEGLVGRNYESHDIECAGFIVLGAIVDSHGAPIHISTLMPLPHATLFQTPTILVASTYACAAKTKLATTLISLLVHKYRKKVVALKMTGCGPRKSTTAFLRAGAAAIFDHVDVGVGTTYGDPADVLSGMDRLLLLAQDVHADVCVVELGGDLIWGCNPQIFTLPLLTQHLVSLLVVNSDALAILGTCNYLHQTLRFPPHKLILFSGPTASYYGMCTRIKGSELKLYDLANQTQLDDVVEVLVRRIDDRRARMLAAQQSTASSSANTSYNNTPTNSSTQQQQTFQYPDKKEEKNEAKQADNNSDSSSSTPVSSSSPPVAAFQYTSFPLTTLSTPSTHKKLWKSVIDWVISAGSFPDGLTLRWSQEEVSRRILSICHLAKFQQSLYLQQLERKRKRVLMKIAKEKEMEEESKDGKNLASSLKAATNQQLSKKQTEKQLQLQQYLLSLPPYSQSDCFIPVPPSTPFDQAAKLLELDAALAQCRKLFVPARVGEEQFWATYFGILFILVSEHIITHSQSEGAAATTTGSSEQAKHVEQPAASTKVEHNHTTKPVAAPLTPSAVTQPPAVTPTLVHSTSSSSIAAVPQPSAAVPSTPSSSPPTTRSASPSTALPSVSALASNFSPVQSIDHIYTYSSEPAAPLPHFSDASLAQAYAISPPHTFNSHYTYAAPTPSSAAHFAHNTHPHLSAVAPPAHYSYVTSSTPVHSQLQANGIANGTPIHTPLQSNHAALPPSNLSVRTTRR